MLLSPIYTYQRSPRFLGFSPPLTFSLVVLPCGRFSRSFYEIQSNFHWCLISVTGPDVWVSELRIPSHPILDPKCFTLTLPRRPDNQASLQKLMLTGKQTHHLCLLSAVMCHHSYLMCLLFYLLCHSVSWNNMKDAEISYFFELSVHPTLR